MEQSVVIAGFGGQGVLFAGKLLAYAGMDNGRSVTWIPSYGPEMRGGTANCTVIISNEPIGAPIVSAPTMAIALNQPSFAKYEPLVQSGGLLLANSSLVATESQRQDIERVYLPANALAESVGYAKLVNVAMLGALLAKRPFLPLAALERALAAQLPPSKMDLLQANLDILCLGFKSAADMSVLDAPAIK